MNDPSKSLSRNFFLKLIILSFLRSLTQTWPPCKCTGNRRLFSK